MKFFAMLAGVVLSATLATAQQPEFPKPGPEHEVLKKFEGTWDCAIKCMGMESKGTSTYKMELGGLWLTSAFEGEVFGSKFSGRGMDTYDAGKKKYTSVWIDSMSTQPMMLEGGFDKEKNTLTLTGDGPGPDGKPTKYKSTTTIKSDKEMHFTMAMVVDGKDNVMIEIVYKKK